MTIDSFIANFEQAIDDIPAGSITPATEFQTLPQWDSLAVLNLLAMIDAEYGIEVPAGKIVDCQTVEALFETICAAK